MRRESLEVEVSLGSPMVGKGGGDEGGGGVRGRMGRGEKGKAWKNAGELTLSCPSSELASLPSASKKNSDPSESEVAPFRPNVPEWLVVAVGGRGRGPLQFQ